MKELTFKLPKFFRKPLAKTFIDLPSGHRIYSEIVRGPNTVCFIFAPVKIFGKILFRRPTFVWTNSIQNAIVWVNNYA